MAANFGGCLVSLVCDSYVGCVFADALDGVDFGK